MTTTPDIELDTRVVAHADHARKLAWDLRRLADWVSAFPDSINEHANVNILTHCTTLEDWDRRIDNAIPNPFEYIDDPNDPYYRARHWLANRTVSITLTIRRELLEDAGRLAPRKDR